MDILKELKKILEKDSCECDNCFIVRAFIKNPNKEILRYKNKTELNHETNKIKKL
jgi:hypothetical protein